jgi:putative transposase
MPSTALTSSAGSSAWHSPGRHRTSCSLAASFAERVIGSIRRECLDLVIVLNERHLRRVLRTYLAYDNVTRPHRSLGNDSLRRRTVRSVSSGHIVTVPEVGGLHHRYQRAA